MKGVAKSTRPVAEVSLSLKEKETCSKGSRDIACSGLADCGCDSNFGFGFDRPRRSATRTTGHIFQKYVGRIKAYGLSQVSQKNLVA